MRSLCPQELSKRQPHFSEFSYTGLGDYPLSYTQRLWNHEGNVTCRNPNCGVAPSYLQAWPAKLCDELLLLRPEVAMVGRISEARTYLCIQGIVMLHHGIFYRVQACERFKTTSSSCSQNVPATLVPCGMQKLTPVYGARANHRSRSVTVTVHVLLDVEGTAPMKDHRDCNHLISLVSQGFPTCPTYIHWTRSAQSWCALAGEHTTHIAWPISRRMRLGGL